jgi:hypothetical protein
MHSGRLHDYSWSSSPRVIPWISRMWMIHTMYSISIKQNRGVNVFPYLDFSGEDVGRAQEPSMERQPFLIFEPPRVAMAPTSTYGYRADHRDTFAREFRAGVSTSGCASKEKIRLRSRVEVQSEGEGAVAGQPSSFSGVSVAKRSRPSRMDCPANSLEVGDRDEVEVRMKIYQTRVLSSGSSSSATDRNAYPGLFRYNGVLSP